VAPTGLPSSSVGADWACSFTRPACPLDEKRSEIQLVGHPQTVRFGDPAY